MNSNLNLSGTKPLRRGLILLNLGTPESPEPRDVGIYLKEFLMDPWVIDIPYLLRWFLVNVLIVPRRSVASGALYRKIWTDRGSPLLFHLLDMVPKVQTLLGDRWAVKPVMRYGKPSIHSGLAAMQREGIQDVLVFPFYPQYSLAATESSIRECQAIAKAQFPEMNLRFVEAFYHHPLFIDAFVQTSRKALEGYSYDHLLFSFHGLPERQVKKTDPTGTHCFSSANCCDSIGDFNRNCYRAQCYSTARQIAEKMGLSKESYTVCFQSRLGRTPWIRPFTDDYYRNLPKKGVKRLAVISPSFVADCLETLEEVQIRGKEEFIQNGGEDLKLVPSLNSSQDWCQAVSQIALESVR